MKTIQFTRTAAIAATLLGFWLSAQAQDTLYFGLDPSKSRGYTTWFADDAESYEIRIYELNPNGNTVISSTTTENNYFQFDPLVFLIPDIGYQVLGFDANGIKISESKLIPNNGPVNGPESEIICAKKCNGKSYAWELHKWAFKNYTGQNDPVTNEPLYTYGNKRLYVTGTAQYSDPQTASYTPFWQPMSSAVYSQLNNGHPYVVENNNVQLYQKVQISDNLSDGPFFDAQNNLVTDGYLIEKKPDQFSYMSNVHTTETSSAEFECATHVNHWASFFNTHHEDWSIYVPGSSPFVTTIPTSLECAPAYGQNDQWEDGIDWYDWLTDLYSEAANIESKIKDGGGFANPDRPTWDEIAEVMNDFSPVISADNESVSAVALISESTPEPIWAYFKKGEEGTRNNGFYLTENTNALIPGIYQVVMYTSDGNAVTSYMEFTKEIAEAKAGDFVTASVNPNPIVNDEIKIDFVSSQEISGQVYVHNLYGEQLYSGPLELLRETPASLQIDVTGEESPMFELIINIIFEDGSVIQRIASTLN